MSDLRWALTQLPPDPWHHGPPEGPDAALAVDPIWGLPATERAAIEDRRHATARETQEGSP